MLIGGFINNIDYGIVINRKRREEFGYVLFNMLVWKKSYKYIYNKIVFFYLCYNFCRWCNFIRLKYILFGFF